MQGGVLFISCIISIEIYRDFHGVFKKKIPGCPKKTEKMRLFDKKISVYEGIHGTDKYKIATVRQFLFDYPKQYEKEIMAVRSAPTEDKQKRLKKSLPMATISGLFSNYSAAGLVEHSGLLAVDIDGKDNPGADMEQLKKDLATVPQIAYIGLSCRGNGLFCVVPIAFPQCHAQHFAAIKDYFSSKGITIDSGCGAITQTRFVSFDPSPYINEKAVKFTQTKFATHRPPSRQHPSIDGNNTIAKVMDYCRTIEATGKDITDKYNDWFRVGAALASLGEAGRTPFHMVSRQYSAYNEAKTERKFNSILRSVHGINIGTFFYICNEHGINLRPG